jgi:hypothetical protein
MYANEGLVDRAVATITRLAHKVTRAATLLLVGSVVICVGSFLLGLGALSGGIESVWIVLAFFFGAIAIGCAARARMRIGRVRKHIPEIASDIRMLVADGRSDVVTIVIPDEELRSGSALELSRGMSGSESVRRVTAQGLANSANFADALRAITTFPWLAIVTVLITSVFAFLGLIFLIALAL